MRDAVVVITGAAGGLGTALVERFAGEGAQLGLLDLDVEALGELEAELRARGVRCHAAVCDVTDRDACERAIESVAAELGGIDVLVNNAGITQRSAFVDTDVEVYRKVMDVNFYGSLYCTKAALPYLIDRRGHIVVISSVAGFAPLLGRTGYCASKHALQGFFGSLRAELRGEGVGVSIVSPSFIDTPIDVNALDGDGARTRHPQSKVGRVMTPDDAAAAVVRATKKRQPFVALGPVAVATRFLMAVWPGLYERLMRRSLRSELQR